MILHLTYKRDDDIVIKLHLRLSYTTNKWKYHRIAFTVFSNAIACGRRLRETGKDRGDVK